ncbi:neocarzinostatin apoprotein domain-containing protein [Streptomyces sp. NPDC006385]|uniref:neocarzinostatin apoprotein domain-containing protein n=1 Tax=Streptomyces sp. NPDC006385 TaxID=3156761 RepID=UPI0033A82F46
MRALPAARAALAVAASAALTLGLATSASAATSTRTVTDGGATYNLSLNSPGTAAAGGQVITVSGSGYNPGQGIYVGLCVVDGAQGASKPTPCLGGQDESGTTGASHWVNNTFGGMFANSSKFGAGGTFSVKIHVKAALDDGSVCGEDVTCAVVTRADHFDSEDRKYDVHVPITFQ